MVVNGTWYDFEAQKKCSINHKSNPYDSSGLIIWLNGESIMG